MDGMNRLPAVSRRAARTLLIVLGFCAGGCGWMPGAFAMRDGRLVQAQDILALPGEPVVMRVRLRSGAFLGGQRNRTVRFVLDGRTHALAATDRKGVAEAAFVPQSAGDYRFRIAWRRNCSGRPPG